MKAARGSALMGIGISQFSLFGLRRKGHQLVSCERGRTSGSEPRPVFRPRLGLRRCLVTLLTAGWVFALSLRLVPVAAAGEGFFMFTDDLGTVHFSDRPGDDRFRAVNLTPRGLILNPNPALQQPSRSELDRIISRAASEQEMDPALIKAVIAAESNFDAAAVSRAGAIGLMQLMPLTAAELGVRAPFHPGQNIRAGTTYLKRMFDRYGVMEHALAAYNAGPRAVDRYGGVPPFPETRAYVARVLRFHSKFRRIWREPKPAE